MSKLERHIHGNNHNDGRKDEGARPCYTEGVAPRIRMDRVTSPGMLTARIKVFTISFSPEGFLLQNRSNVLITRASCPELNGGKEGVLLCYTGSSPAEVKLVWGGL